MASQLKGEASSSEFEVDSQDLHLQSQVRTLRRVDSVRVAITTLALLMGLSILGVSADAINVYNSTHVSQNYFLALWPDDFDLRPTVALVVGATIVVLSNAASLLFSKVGSLRQKASLHTPLMFVAPFVGLAAAFIAMIFFYAVNASDTYDTLLSWTCRWMSVNMMQKPHFGTLCKESWAGLYLAILLIPVEAAVVAIATWQMKVEKHTRAYTTARKSPSPIMT